MQNGDESGTDCGGSCPSCDPEQELEPEPEPEPEPERRRRQLDAMDSHRRSLGTRCVASGGTVPCRAAAAPAKVVPAGWVGSANTPPPPPPPPVKVNVAVTATVVNTDISVNDTTVALISLKGLKGFTPRCDSAETQCAIDDKRFIYFIAITQEVQLEKQQLEFQHDLIDQLWIDPQTRDVEVRFIVYNGNLGLFAIVSIQFEFLLGGEIAYSININPLDLELLKGSEISQQQDGSTTTKEYGENSDAVRNVFELLVVFQVVWTAYLPLAY